ncbi:MAG: LPP20 family lipoprotein [Deltaproteobacteria bacterium]|nr:LPP20 family lipoprotein [Deltaproteobacteria bacterium]
MKKLAIISIVIFLSLFFVIPREACAQNAVESFENGKIDWTTGVASAIGIGAPPPKPVNMAQARAMAKRAAVIVARRNLLEIIKGVRIDSLTLIKDFVVQSDIIRNQVDGYLERSQVVDIAYMSDGSVEATVAMNLRGGFSNLMLPKSIQS